MRKLRSSIGNSFAGMFFFGLLAPPIGSLALSLPFISMSIFAEIGGTGGTANLLYVFGFPFSAVVLSYVFGGIPALITGVIAGLFQSFLKSWTSYLAVGVLGSALSCVFAVAVTHRSFFENFGILALWGVPGLCGGIVTAYMFRKNINGVKS